MRIIVTGGAGFIGSAVCRHLVGDLGHDVVNVDKLTYAACLASLDPIARDPRYRFVKADICDRVALDRVFAETQPAAVVHLAAESHVDRSITGAGDFVETNVVGTCHLLEAARAYWSRLDGPARGAFRFLHVSTDEVYGSLDADAAAFTEAHRYDPSSPYSASKAGADHLASAWWRTYGLPVVISNCSNNYGPCQFPEKLVPLMILNGLEGRALPVYGDGAHVRDWLHVEDHARALAMILAHGRPGGKYNVGARSERTNLALVHAICDALDRLAPGPAPRRSLIRFVAERPGHDRRYAIDPSKTEREIGWRPRQGLEEGIERTVRWYIDNEAWWRPLRAERYSGERLGLIAG